MSRHLLIPDTQCRPGEPRDHLAWAAQAIVDYKPDTVVHLGDHWDMHSLSSYDAPGSKSMEGARYVDDIAVGNEGFEMLCKPMEQEQHRLRRNKKGRWNPRKVFLFGNHENRVDRAVALTPKLEGAITRDHMDTRDFERHDFLERVWQDGVLYSHFFQNSHSSFPIGGSVDNRLNKIGASFVQGHEQGFRYGNRIMGSGKTVHGLVAGSFYPHIETYRGAQGQRHWRGIVVLNEVRDGDFCIMPLTMDYLARHYTGMSAFTYFTKKYPDKNWEHLQ